jgi:hypothetical protein
MWRAALDAADYALRQFEARLDGIAGRTARVVVGRYAALFFIGVPLAWALNAFHWGSPSRLGLIGGVLLYAIVDIGKHAFSLKKKA